VRLAALVDRHRGASVEENECPPRRRKLNGLEKAI
jgi:hypothetical protein